MIDIEEQDAKVTFRSFQTYMNIIPQSKERLYANRKTSPNQSNDRGEREKRKRRKKKEN